MDKTHAYKVLSPLLLNGQHCKPGAQVELTLAQAADLKQRGIIEPVADQPTTTPPAPQTKGKGKQQPHQASTANAEASGADE